MLQEVAVVIGKLEAIQGKTSDEEFANRYFGGIARQTWAAYKSGLRDISLEFVGMVWVSFPELHIPIQLALEEIGKNKINSSSMTDKVGSK